MITSSANENIKYVKSLARRHIRQAERAFVAEGVRLLEDALNATQLPHMVLYNEGLLARTERGLSLLSRLQHSSSNPRLLEVSDKLLGEIADTVTPQGIIAVFPFVDWQMPAVATPLLVILDGLQDPGNLGTIMRSAEAAGTTALLLTSDSVDVYNPKVVRAAMGAHFRLPYFPNLAWPDISRKLTDLGVTQVVATMIQASTSIYELDWCKSSALIIGNEGRGISESTLAAATVQANIPMSGTSESLNAAIAASVIVFEVARQRRTHQTKGE